MLSRANHLILSLSFSLVLSPFFLSLFLCAVVFNFLVDQKVTDWIVSISICVTSKLIFLSCRSNFLSFLLSLFFYRFSLCLYVLLFNGLSLVRLFSVFSNKQLHFYIKPTYVKKCPSNLQCWDSNPWPLKHQSSLIITRPVLPPCMF